MTLEGRALMGERCLLTMFLLAHLGACGPELCETVPLEAASGELTPDRLHAHCSDRDCGSSACEDEEVVMVGFAEFINTTNPDRPELQPGGVIFLSSSDVSGYECSRSTVSVLVRPETESEATSQAVTDLFRAIHATRERDDQTHSTRRLRVTGKIQGQDLPTNGACVRGLSILVSDPAQVVIN